MTDHILLQKLHTQPNAGMELLMERYAGLVYTVVRGVLPPDLFSAGDAEECAADVFSEFYCDLDKYDPRRGSIKGWLCAMARNTALDLVRRRGRERGAVSLDDCPAGLEPGSEGSLEGDFENAETRRALLEAVRDLGEPDRQIVLRKFYLGQPSREIAQVLGLTVSNVDTRTHRALKKLREALGGDQA